MMRWSHFKTKEKAVSARHECSCGGGDGRMRYVTLQRPVVSLSLFTQQIKTVRLSLFIVTSPNTGRLTAGGRRRHHRRSSTESSQSGSHPVDLDSTTCLLAYLNWTELHINLATQWIKQLINCRQNNWGSCCCCCCCCSSCTRLVWKNCCWYSSSHHSHFRVLLKDTL